MRTIEERLAGLKIKAEKELEDARIKPGFGITDNGELQFNKEAFAILDSHTSTGSDESSSYGKDRLTIAEDADGNLLLIIASTVEVNGLKTVKLGKTTRRAKQTASAPVLGRIMEFYGIDQVNHTSNQFVLNSIVTNPEYTIAVINPSVPVLSDIADNDPLIVDRDTVTLGVTPLLARELDEMIDAQILVDVPFEIEKIADELNIAEEVSMVSHHDLPDLPDLSI